MRKELVVLTGFFGAGKTTVLKSVLKHCQHRNVAILLNDFGEIPVDGTILQQSGLLDGILLEIGGGSVFCACLRESFIQSMIELSKRTEDLVIIEASGMSDPSNIDRMLQLSGLDTIFEHTSTICLFDPIKSLKLASVLEVIPRQLNSSTVAVITKCDLADAIEIKKAKEYISYNFPELPIITCSNGEIDFESIPHRACKSFAFGFNTPENRPDSITLSEVLCTIDEFIVELKAFEALLRVKGAVRATDGTWFLSDTGKEIDKCLYEKDFVPLTVICMQGTSNKLVNILRDKNMV